MATWPKVPATDRRGGVNLPCCRPHPSAADARAPLFPYDAGTSRRFPVLLTSPARNAAASQPFELRRTFAIISHPDAGKTTLTEKLLAASGAIQQAGAVRARRDHRATRSDWMAIEQQRGISISSSVMTFEHDGLTFNLLDTPGHSDFSEDTYRTLTAVDSAVMVIDMAKGI